MPLNALFEAAGEVFLEVSSEVVSELAEPLFGTFLPVCLTQRRYSEAYAQSFFCHQCYGTSKKPLVKKQWYLYRCQDCQSKWGVLKKKPSSRREKRKRASEEKQAT